MVEIVNSSVVNRATAQVRAKQERLPPRQWTRGGRGAVSGNCFEEGGVPVVLRLLQDRIGVEGRCGAEGMGRRGVKLWARVRGGVPGHPGPRGSGLWALSSAAVSAWGGSRLPRSYGARAARSRERRGKQQARREGAGGTAGGRDAGAAPSPPGLGAPGPTVWGSLGPRGQRRIPRPLTGQVACPTPVPRVLGCYQRSGNPWRLSSEGPFP